MSTKKIAVFVGSFDPFTIGHANILQKAEAIFGVENVIIAVGLNPEKVQKLSIGESNPNNNHRVLTINNNFPTKKVEGFYGLLTDFVWDKEKEGYDVTVVKGLRDGNDFLYESTQLRFMQDLKPDIKVVFISCDAKYVHISSSAYRQLEKIRPGLGHYILAKEELI